MIKTYVMDEKAIGGKEYFLLRDAVENMSDVSNLRAENLDMLFERPDSYLIIDSLEDGTFLGLFAIQIYHDSEEDTADCYVNIAYTSEKFRKTGVFKRLLKYTKEIFPNILQKEFDTVSFGVYNHNERMHEVMSASGCDADHFAMFLDDATLYSTKVNKESRINA